MSEDVTWEEMCDMWDWASACAAYDRSGGGEPTTSRAATWSGSAFIVWVVVWVESERAQHVTSGDDGYS